MTYFKIGETDFSPFVSSLKINKTAVYNTQTNANGDNVVDYVNSKRTIEVNMIAMNEEDMMAIQNAIDAFSVSLSFLNPKTNTLEQNVACIIPADEVDYYTIRADRTFFNAFVLTFYEL